MGGGRAGEEGRLPGQPGGRATINQLGGPSIKQHSVGSLLFPMGEQTKP